MKQLQKLKALRKLQLPTKTLLIGIFSLIILCGIFIGLKKDIFFKNQTTKIGFENIGELATQTAYCTEINVTDASRELFGHKIPFTQSKYIYSYNVTIQAGFDFTEITWELSDHSINVQLPEATVLSCDIDPESFELYHEEESLFRQISMEENNEALKSLKQSAQENALANGLLENARSNAETILTSFFSSVYNLDEYTISFTDK